MQLYSSENWILTENCQDHLTSFLGEIVKRALKWPKHFSNSVALFTTRLKGIHSRLLSQNLSFLRQQLVEEVMAIATQAVTSMLDDQNSYV